MGQMVLAGVTRRPSANGTRWGGRRKGAGRKRANPKRGGAHVRRPVVQGRVPMHVSVRLCEGAPRLRQRRGYQVVRRAVGIANRFDGARICEVSIQHNHVHLLVEANDQPALARAMRSFAIGVAKNVNRRWRRRGAVIGDRYHVVPLRTPTQVRRALAYVLGNWRRHGEDVRLAGPRRMTDRYSTGPQFDGWDVAVPPGVPWPRDGTLPVRRPRTWLLRVGWRAGGLLSPWQRPGPLA